MNDWRPHPLCPVFLFDYREESGGIWMPAFLARLACRLLDRPGSRWALDYTTRAQKRAWH